MMRQKRLVIYISENLFVFQAEIDYSSQHEFKIPSVSKAKNVDSNGTARQDIPIRRRPKHPKQIVLL